jgi:hypothetical protein
LLFFLARTEITAICGSDQNDPRLNDDDDSSLDPAHYWQQSVSVSDAGSTGTT